MNYSISDPRYTGGRRKKKEGFERSLPFFFLPSVDVSLQSDSVLKFDTVFWIFLQ
jgi:hypothetical protein